MANPKHKISRAADDHIGRSVVHIPTFDVSDEVQRARFQEFEGFLGDLVAFGVLLTDAQKTDPRSRLLKDMFGIFTSHEAELEDMLSGAIHISPHIQHDGCPREGGQCRRNGRPFDPLDEPQDKKGRDHSRPRVSSADHRIRFTGLDQLRRHPDRRIPLLASN